MVNFLAFLEIFRQYLLIQTTGSIGVVYRHVYSGGSRPSDKGEGVGGGGVGTHPDPEIRGRWS